VKCPECGTDGRLCQCPLADNYTVDVPATVIGDMNRALFAANEEVRMLRSLLREVRRYAPPNWRADIDAAVGK
jgi:hypothetical protein